MDIEDLSKSQLLLLTILVNFVVSIATGVLTVSLLDAAPQTVTQTVNRIVDHTIETVSTQVPVIGKPAATPSSEDLLTAAIAADAAHTVTIQYKVGAQTLSSTGLYIPSKKIVVGASPDLQGHVTVAFPNGTSLEADRSGADGSLIRYSFAADATPPNGSDLALIAAASLKQGQTVIGLTADGKAVTGIIGKIDTDGIHADLPGIPAGGAVVNLSGQVIGISAGNGLFLAAERVTALEAVP